MLLAEQTFRTLQTSCSERMFFLVRAISITPPTCDKELLKPTPRMSIASDRTLRSTTEFGTPTTARLMIEMEDFRTSIHRFLIHQALHESQARGIA